MTDFRVLLVLVCAMLALLPRPSQAENLLERLAVIALTPADGQAVVRWPDGTLHLLQGGDQFQGTTATLVQVLPDRLVVEEHLTPDGRAPQKRLLWIYKAPPDGTPSRVVRLWRHAPPDQPHVRLTLPPRQQQ